MAAQPDDLPDPFDTDSAVESLEDPKAPAKRSRKKAGADAIAQETANVAQAVSENEVKNETYHTPPFSLLTRGKKGGRIHIFAKPPESCRIHCTVSA